MWGRKAKERGRGMCYEKSVTTVAGFEDKRWGPRNKDCGEGHWKVERAGTDSPPEPPEGMQPCGHFHFPPARPTSDF